MTDRSCFLLFRRASATAGGWAFLDEEKERMVCVTITRAPRYVDNQTAIEIRIALHKAIVRFMNVRAEDVELRVRDVGPLDVNTTYLAIEIDTGPGKDNWRIGHCEDIVKNISDAIMDKVPAALCAKGMSNLWMRISAKGRSMPVGCPDHMH